MKKMDLILSKVFLYGLPVVVVFVLYSFCYKEGFINHDHIFSGFLNGLGGLVFGVWMTFSIYLSLRLMVSEPFRDQVISRITFIRERDEREEIMTGKATRTVFMTSLAILIFLFCLSCFQVSIYRVPPEMAIDGKTGFISLGLGFNLLEQSRPGMPGDPLDKEDIFTYSGLPLSGTTLILILILWQIISYNYSMRRLIR
jgi:hypothetical protein